VRKDRGKINSVPVANLCLLSELQSMALMAFGSKMGISQAFSLFACD
jgi:hypothetical protein